MEATVPRIYISVAEAAEASGLGIATIKRRLSAGDIRSYKIGRRRVIRPAELEADLEALHDQER